MIVNNRCPKCDEERLRTWDELGEDEREVVRRLPGSRDYTAAERESVHQWCTRCWYEEVQNSERTV